MGLTITKIIIVVISITTLILIKPIVRFCMRDRYKVYKDVNGNDVKIKTYGYSNGKTMEERRCVK